LKLRGQGPYLIVDPKWRSRKRLIAELEEVIRAGAGLVQLRDKSQWDAESRDFAEQVLAICRQTHVPLIVNDDPVRAHAIGADGVHLGVADPSIGSARSLLGERSIIGVSAYADLERGRAAEREGADYIAFGSIYPSPSKPHAKRVSLDFLKMARRTLDTPLCAIGGIRPDNARPIVLAGISWLAVISGIWETPDPVAAMHELAQAFEPVRGKPQLRPPR